MKKLTLILVTVTGALYFTAFISSQDSSRDIQSNQLIPADVLKVAQKSCLNCHAEQGERLARSHVNLSKWNSYSAGKQADKAKAMCRMISRGKMPPKRFKEKNPDFVLTKDEINTICTWSSSLQTDKK